MKNKNACIAIAVVCVILTSAITLQIRTMKEENSAVSISTANSELRDSVLEWKERSENAQRDLESATKELEEIRQASTSNDNTAVEKQEELKRYNRLIGLTDVAGDGIILTVSDSSTESSLMDINNLIVHDSDLRNLVNELANAGAEAISINGERIVSTTCITCAGNVIQINGNRVGSPFEIRAIGNPESLYGAITRPGGYTSMLESREIQVQSTKSTNIQIPKYSGALTQNSIESTN